ncbi:MAG: dihydroorotase [Chloroflexi bacterium]|nr:dihydroorotase [Chloroflexota bacterium]
MPTIVKGGRIIDPSQGLDSIGDILIRDGKIAGVYSGGFDLPGRGISADSDLHVIDASGLIVSPGFIDLHSHLREPGYEEKETIATGSRSAAAGGFTTICCMPNTNPAIDNAATLDLVKRTAAAEAVVRVLPIAAITKNRDGAELTEMAELARGSAVGFSDDGNPVSNSRIMRSALDYARMLGKPIISHCEDLQLAKDGVVNEGVIATRLGLKGMPAAAEDIMVARDIALAELVGGKLHLAHVSSAGSVDLVRRAKARGLSVTAEVTPHHLTLTEDWVAGQRVSWGLMFPYWGPTPPYDTNTKVNPPLRRASDIAALIEGLKDGTIDAIATDHAPHTIVDKQCEYDFAAFGISGLETALGALMTLVHREDLDLTTLVAKMTVGPARVLNLSLGTLAEGAPADITIFDPDEEWVVDPSSFRSKGRNTPLAGLSLRGRVVCTLVQGNVVHSRAGIGIGESPAGVERVWELR